MLSTAFILMTILTTLVSPPKTSTISLAGTWQFALDPSDVGQKDSWFSRGLGDTIDLPTTTDVAGKGPEQPVTQNTWGLTRKHPYEGLAWYRRSIAIPADWAGRDIEFTVERTKRITVYVDGGAPIDGGLGLCTAHEVPLGDLTPGEHTLTVCVDNTGANWPERVRASHMLENTTQTNWNGMLGGIELRTEDRFGIRGVQAAPVAHDPRKLQVKAYLDRNPDGLTLHATLSQGGRILGESTATGDTTVIAVPSDAGLWDEFQPNLCRLDVVADGTDFHATWSAQIGLRDFRSANGAFLINGRRTFLRGKHDACVFPLTGHPPMDVSGWERYFRTVKSYGINHVRFHSWCPPDAAFSAADRLGVYLQPELPYWGDPAAPGVESFLTSEGQRILQAYGHHPSFVMLGLGNELWGAAEPRYRIVTALRAIDPSRLYDHGSNSWYWAPQEYDGTDYRVTAFAKTGEAGKFRGSYAFDNEQVAGYIQIHAPGTMHTYSEATAGKRFPAVSHEVGQYQVFPNFAEATKYRGALRADNFTALQSKVANAGLLDQAEEFRQASGLLALQCYREEIEAALRTPDMDGFQLLDLQDYPGQGTALVGMLDAFMDSKGFVTPAEWRTFCSEFVPLALFPKYTWRSDETFTAEIRVANYGPAAVRDSVTWELKQGRHVIGRQTGAPVNLPTGTATTVGAIACSLRATATPARLQLSVTVHGRTSTWPIWVYPAPPAKPVPTGLELARSLDAGTMKRLTGGASILLIPPAADLTNSLPGCFAPDFWTYQMFGKGNPPGTMGLLIENDHPALGEFPTRYYSEWQWQDLVRHSRAVILDKLPGYKSIVQPIDNVFRNHRLGSVFEFQVGKGRLLVCAFDVLDMPDSPEAAQLLRSLEDYVGSDRFRPATTIDPTTLSDLISIH